MLLISVPAAAGAIGAIVAAVRRPGARLDSGIQHFAAGVAPVLSRVAHLAHVTSTMWRSISTEP